MLKDLPSPTIFAHRGASAYAPENTIAAFELALKQNADAIELDAKLTADGHVVVIHDQTVDRTTDGSGRVNKMSFAELRELDAGSHFDRAFRGEQIPILEEVFESVGKKIFINVELTNYTSITDNLPQKTAAIVKEFGVTEHVLFSSFNPIALLRIRRLLPETPIGLLALPGKKGALARSSLATLLGYQALHPEKDDVSQCLIEKTHQRGCRMYVYTVNEEEDIRRLVKMRVDGIFTDDPLRARRVINELRPDKTQ